MCTVKMIDVCEEISSVVSVKFEVMYLSYFSICTLLLETKMYALVLKIRYLMKELLLAKSGSGTANKYGGGRTCRK